MRQTLLRGWIDSWGSGLRQSVGTIRAEMPKKRGKKTYARFGNRSVSFLRVRVPCPVQAGREPCVKPQSRRTTLPTAEMSEDICTRCVGSRTRNPAPHPPRNMIIHVVMH